MDHIVHGVAAGANPDHGDPWLERQSSFGTVMLMVMILLRLSSMVMTGVSMRW